MERPEIIDIILDLCSEDRFGSWELWWKVREKIQRSLTTDVKGDFVDSIAKLVASKRIIVEQGIADKFKLAEFNRMKLLYEIEHSERPDPNQFYWFNAI